MVKMKAGIKWNTLQAYKKQILCFCHQAQNSFSKSVICSRNLWKLIVETAELKSNYPALFAPVRDQGCWWDLTRKLWSYSSHSHTGFYAPNDCLFICQNYLGNTWEAIKLPFTILTCQLKERERNINITKKNYPPLGGFS